MRTGMLGESFYNKTAVFNSQHNVLILATGFSPNSKKLFEISLVINISIHQKTGIWLWLKNNSRKNRSTRTKATYICCLWSCERKYLAKIYATTI